MLGSDMLQSQRMLIKGKFSEKPTPEFCCFYLQLGKMDKWKYGQGVACFDQH